MSWLGSILGRKADGGPADGNGARVAEAAPPGPGPGTGTTAAAAEQVPLARADNPIRTVDDDALGRGKLAEVFCRNVLRLDPSEGLVVGVLGPWGSGKTSFVNLARQHFADSSVAVVDFNPWMFSGAEQLVQAFFAELSAQLKVKPGLEDVGAKVEEYGELFSNLAWLPLIGPWIEGGKGLTKLVASLLQRKKSGVGGQRDRVSKALREVKRPIVVVIDDIDRLSTPEIRDMFRLVRLTASFPNLIYLLAFDRRRVEAALTDDGFPGRSYLEKILQVSFDLPSIPDHVLDKQVFNALDRLLSDEGYPGTFDEQLWPDVYMEVVKPLIANMRDVRRYAVAVAGTVSDLQGQIAMVDVLALEAVRVFLPDVFVRLPSMVLTLTATSEAYDNQANNDAAKGQIESLIQAAALHSAVVTALIERLFMAAQRHLNRMRYGPEWSQQWRRARRVAHADFLRLYLERVAGQGLIAFNLGEQAWATMPNQAAFEDFLASTPRNEVIDVIRSLEAYEDEVSADRVLPGVVALLNVIPELPEVDRGFFGIGKEMTVGRVIYRLIRSQNSSDFVEQVARRALPQLRTLSAKLQLIEMIGHRENVGHKLVPEGVANDLLAIWSREVQNAPADRLAAEPGLLRTLYVARRETPPGGKPIEVPDDTRVAKAMLQSAKGQSRSQSFGSRAVKVRSHLAWDALAEVYGGEDVLRARIEQLRLAHPEGMEDLLALADRYLSGWRPKDFGDDD